ncbi:MAG: flagellar biosynthesis protein FlhB [Hyphomicrobiaceae bacterium]
MAGEQEKDSKTEEATEKKTRDAIERGNVPFSKEASISVSLFGILIATTYMIGDRSLELASTLTRFISQAHEWPIENGADASRLVAFAFAGAALLVAPIAILLMVSGFAASFAQNPPQFAYDRIKPDWSRISPASGWKRLFGVQGVVEFLKSLFKLAAVGAVAVLFLRWSQNDFVNALFMEPAGLPLHVKSMAGRAILLLAIATLFLVTADVIWSRLHWLSELRMTKQEVKDEHKQLDGDPLIKARQRSLARQRSRQRMLAAVPRATFVITNPTHYAIAMRYVREESAAPVVVAKGQDLVALRIRAIAEEHNIPIVEDKPLARALYSKVRVDQAIPAEFYKAVASVVYFLMSRKPGQRPSVSVSGA